MQTKPFRRLSWVLRLLAAAILAQTLFFKFTGAAESRYIFERLGAEPWGRFGSGVVELIAVILLLVPRTVAVGAAIGAGTMLGALAAHLGPLGIEVEGDGGLLFTLALVTLASLLVVLWLHRGELPIVGSRLCGGSCAAQRSST